MTKSRKRKRGQPSVRNGGDDGPSRKKQAITDKETHPQTPVEHELLSRYYPILVTLRQYALSKLPVSSRLRRKKLATVGLSVSSRNSEISNTERGLAHLLDTTLVGLKDDPESVKDDHWEQWVTFSQRGDESYVSLSGGSADAAFSQAEVSPDPSR